MDELIQLFSLERCSKAGARFDYEKGKWFNKEYLAMKSDDEIAALFAPIVEEKGYKRDMDTLKYMVSLVRNRVHFVKELWYETNYMFEAPTEYDEKSLKKRWKEDSPAQMRELYAVLEGLQDYSAVLENEKTVLEWVASKEYKLGDVMNAFRITIVGAARGPQIFDILNIIGKEETLRRLSKALEILK